MAKDRGKATLSILHVEDDENDIFLVRHVLQKMAPESATSVARDGDEAEAYLSGRGAFGDRVKFPLPGVVLMDLKLPKKTGLEVLEWMKSQPGLKEIPVFILSSSEEESDVHRAREAGVTGYLIKRGGLTEMAESLAPIAAYLVNQESR